MDENEGIRCRTTRSETNKRTHLQHVGQQGQNRVETLELSFLLNGLSSSVGDSSQELSKDAEIDDERRGKERIFANVEERLGTLNETKSVSRVIVDSRQRLRRTSVFRPPMAISE